MKHPIEIDWTEPDRPPRVWHLFAAAFFVAALFTAIWTPPEPGPDVEICTTVVSS